MIPLFCTSETKISKGIRIVKMEHGVDIDSRKFWQGGFDYVGEQISKLQTLL